MKKQMKTKVSTMEKIKNFMKGNKKKKAKKKFNLIKDLLIAEYSIIAVILITSYYARGVYNIIKSYQTSIEDLKEIACTLSMAHEDLPKQEIIEKQVNYMAKEEKSVIDNPSENERVYLGKFKITHYCACKKCCGENAQGITASGKRVEEGKTIAVDTKVIKMGSKVYIEGYGEMEAQDTGSAIKGNIIDVYVADHNQALQMGVVYKDVYLLK